jgi:hypothetical protein
VSADDGVVSRFRIQPSVRRIQVPQLVVAILLVALSALAAVVVFSQASARVPVLVLAGPVERGQILTEEDLRVVYVASDDPVATLPAEALGSLVGRMAVADFGEGTLVASGFFVPEPQVAPGERVVGLELAPGEYPTLGLAPSDVVDVVTTGAVSGESSGVLVEDAVVFEVTELGTQGTRFVSLRLPVDMAPAVVRAAAEGGVRLVLVGDTR